MWMGGLNRFVTVSKIFEDTIVGVNSVLGELAAELVQQTVIKEKCFKKPLVLYSDNGSPMKSQTLLEKLYELGITPS